MTSASAFALALLAAAAASSPAAAGPAVPDADAHLVIAGPDGRGGYDVGVAIDIPQGWHTYWRNPGDSGVPPMLVTDGSVNLGRLDLAYPAPTRLFDGYGTSLVYDGAVVLPARVVAADPAAPVRLVAAFDFGYCKEICVPAHADFDVDLAPGDARDAQAAAVIAAARRSVPVPEAAADADHPRLVSVAPGEAGHLTITVETAGPADHADVFVEGPPGWYLSPPEIEAQDGRRAVFDLSLDGMPQTATLAGAPLTVTITDGRLATEAVRTVE